MESNMLMLDINMEAKSIFKVSVVLDRASI